MRVERLITGWITSPAGIWRSGEPMDQPLRFPVPAYVIEVGEERILVDTGLHPGAVADASAHYGVDGALAMFNLEQDQGIDELVDLQTITKVVLTHLHFDHASGVPLLPRSVPIYLQRREWDGGQDPATVERNFFMPGDYAAAAGQLTLVDGDHDLLGDGSIRLLSTPGHTPGHQSVQVGEGLVLGADVALFSETLDDLRFPVFGDDAGAQVKSAERLRAMRDAGITVIPGHDPQVLSPGEVLL